MPRKAKPTKHSAADLARRQRQVNEGGGSSGAAQRTDAKLQFVCFVCKAPSPSEKSMKEHYEAKHLSLGPWTEEVANKCLPAGTTRTFTGEKLKDVKKIAKDAKKKEQAKKVKKGGPLDLAQMLGA